RLSFVLGNGGACDIGVQNGGLLAKLLHGHGQHGCDGALAHAALAADHGDDLLHMGIGVGLSQKILLLAVGAAFAAACAIAGTITHGKEISFFVYFSLFYAGSARLSTGKN